MNFTVYSKDDNGNKLKFEIHPKFDSRPLDHVTIQQNSIKYEEVEFIYHDNQNDSPQILEDDSNALTQLDNVLTKDIETPVQNQFSKEVSIAMCYSSIIALFNLIFISMLVRATLTEFLSQRIINQKYISKEQKKDAQHNNKLVIPLLIVAYCSIFEVSAVTNYLINSTYDDVGSQNITVTQPTDEFQVINCTFKNCWNSGASGGALYINISNGGKCYILNTTFINCTTNTYGGAIFIYIYKGGELTIDGLCSFTDCWALWYGGGIYAQIQGVNSRLLLEDGLIFERCRTNQIGTHFKYGGGIYLNILYNSSIIINKVSCIDCESDAGGGGMFISDDSYETQKLNGTLFQRCNAGYGAGLDIYLFNNNASLQLINLTFIGCQGYYGGGLNIDTLNNTKFLLLGCQLQDCSSYDGGGIQLQISRLCLFEISNAQFKNCSGEYQGGGIYANISFGGKLIIDSCSFYLCNSGNGGGIYVIINFPSQNSFIIKDTLIQGCKALNNTNSSLRYSESGFGGGLFLGALRDYDPSSKLIDLHGLKIYNNTADKFGQSLFVAMTKVVECNNNLLNIGGEYQVI
ncbi:MAG: hypothetical protein EZS28_019563 [Streblomastix strix]|uniref:Right handed beta helix domain-containing protein n=1 Tax=Streblomastix strix TaxID=222440 RepID=A0A5J4VR90_9EUKA|nr:MAG: hypothetical protein EZS28_019563 [Streblomastix strix]